MTGTGKVAIVYMSCDKYADVWPSYFTLFRRFWPDCALDIYILTNHAGPDIEGTRKICVGADISWSSNMLAALRRVDAEYVLLLLDDFFLVEPVPNRWVSEQLEWAVQHQVDCLRLSPCHPHATERINQHVGRVPPGALYRTSTRFPVWRKETLASILDPKETAWEFELQGADRSDAYERFYVSDEEPFQFVNAVIKGRWNPYALRRLRELGVTLNLARRPVMNTQACLMETLRIARTQLLLTVPYTRRRSVRRFGLKVLEKLL